MNSNQSQCFRKVEMTKPQPLYAVHNDEEESTKPNHFIIEKSLVTSYRMINRESYLNPWLSSTQDEIKEAEEEFDSRCVELNKFELEMLEQYREVSHTFATLCIRKLVQQKPLIYNLMSRIYGVFEKYGIDSGHRDEFVLEFVEGGVSNSSRYLRIGEGKFNGLFCYSKYTLRFNVREESGEKDLRALVNNRVKLVNGELSTFEKEFRLVIFGGK
jgi:hypothetical protein